jgi:hypothetical protein
MLSWDKLSHRSGTNCPGTWDSPIGTVVLSPHIGRPFCPGRAEAEEDGPEV